MTYFLSPVADKIAKGEVTEIYVSRIDSHIYYAGTSFIPPYVTTGQGRTVYQIEGIYTVFEGRKKSAFGKAQITHITQGDAREISQDRLLANGFNTRRDFWLAWNQNKFHDIRSLPRYRVKDRIHVDWDGDEDALKTALLGRKDKFYKAWILQIKYLGV